MLQNGYRQSRWAARIAVTAFTLVLGTLVFCGFAAASPKPGGAAPAAPGKDPVCMQVYQHTFDEVFQAVLETSERKGYPLLDKDKEKGTISVSADKHIDFYIHVEALNTKPETRVTIDPKYKGFKVSSGAQREFSENFLKELLKVLSTYH